MRFAIGKACIRRPSRSLSPNFDGPSHSLLDRLKNCLASSFLPISSWSCGHHIGRSRPPSAAGTHDATFSASAPSRAFASRAAAIRRRFFSARQTPFSGCLARSNGSSRRIHAPRMTGAEDRRCSSRFHRRIVSKTPRPHIGTHKPRRGYGAENKGRLIAVTGGQRRRTSTSDN
jgi:hypothetical protein